ncbi:MAG: GGDEF domain-containing protein [Treponema sp.]|nr:GGDEF domain-containing protein [Treponema sp.]
MKQFQFEVKNLNYLRRELSRVKRFCSTEGYTSVYFQIFTQLVDFKEIREITRVIESDFPDAEYYGSQTFGNIYEGNLGKWKTMIVCSVFEFESTRTELFFINSSKRNADFKSLEGLWDYVNKHKWVKGVELTTTILGSEKYLSDGHIENLRENVKVFGGISCNPLSISSNDSFVFTKEFGKSDCAVIAVLVGGEDIHVQCNYFLGWEGLGKNFTITKCDQNKILEIDDKPAMNIYRKYLKIENDENFLNNVTTFPLLVEQNGVECIRIPYVSEDQDSLTFGINFKEGMKVRLSYGDKPSILNSVRSRVPEIAAYSPESIRFYSCCIRRTFWGDDRVSDETEIFDSIAPTIGCYTHGEIIRIRNHLYHMNATMVYALIREGDAYDLDYSVEEFLDSVEEENAVAPKLLNYVGAVSEELEGQFNRTMLGLADTFISMFLINMEKETILQIDKGVNTAKYLSQKNGFSEKMEHFLRCSVTSDTIDKALDFCDFNTLVSRMKNLNVMDCEIKGKTIGWTRMQFIVINRDENGNPVEFVFTAQGIDAQKREKMEQQRIIQSLADTYYTLHVIDLKNDTFNEVSASKIIHNLYEQEKEKTNQEILWNVMKFVCAPEYLEGLKEFTRLSTLNKRLASHKMVSFDFLGTLDGWARASFINYELDPDGKLSKVLFVTQIIDEEKRREEMLMRSVKTDGLTELLNRRAFEDDLNEIRHGQLKRNFSIVSIDLNGLKETNDDNGHEAGDELIKAAANILKINLGIYGKVYRTGGDEFIAILYVGKEDLKQMLKKIENQVKDWKGNFVSCMALSVGWITASEKPGASVSELLKIADERMYENKEEYYRQRPGGDRRAQRGAYEVICQSYLKVLRINLSDDTYSIIKTDDSEMNKDKGFEKNSISEWLQSFAKAGQIHKDDVEMYLYKTSLEYLRKHFSKTKETFVLKYRRKVGTDYKNVLMEILSGKDFSKEKMDVFLYVKDISI